MRYLTLLALLAFSLFSTADAQSVRVQPSSGAPPVTFVGNTAGAANTYTIASPTPTGFTLTDQFIVCGSVSATNTGASTLNVNATGATAIKKQTAAGLAALIGGEMVASNTQYCWQYNATGTAWVLLTTLGSGVTSGATSATVTQAQWDYGQSFLVNTAAQTLTLPAATTLSPNGGIVVVTVGQSVTLAPAAGDGINGGTIGTPITIPANYVAYVTSTGTSGTGAINVPLGFVAGTNVTLTPNSDGTTTLASTGGSGDLIKIATQIASNSAALTFTNIGSYDYYRLECRNLVPSVTSDSLRLRVSEDNGATYKTAGSYNWYWTYTQRGGGSTTTAQLGADTDSSIGLAGGIGASGVGQSAVVQFGGLSNTSMIKFFSWSSNYFDGTNYINPTGSGSWLGDNGAINALEILELSGNITSGKCTLWGYNS